MYSNFYSEIKPLIFMIILYLGYKKMKDVRKHINTNYIVKSIV